MANTGFLFHELYMWHDPGSAALWYPARLTVQPGEHAENPETKRRFRNLLEVSGLLDRLTRVDPRRATEEEVLRVHTRAYLERIKALSADRGGDAGEAAPFGTGSFEIALLAAGGTLAMLDAVVTGRVGNGYALVRPPGHHAEPDQGRGFCIFANVAIALHHARRVHGIERAAVVDWDVHHGNGTQRIFYDDPNVLTLSIHQDNFYPLDSGHLHETGAGAGRGFNINVPLPPGSGREAYLATLERVVAPALRRFRPELIVVASGFDGSIYDPLGRMMVTSSTYRRMTRILLELASELCDGRLLLSHEGGYSAAYVPFCGLAVMEALAGISSGVEDVFARFVDDCGGHQLYPHQADVIEKAAALAGSLPQSRAA
jgi:acetoin utilization deacetylase AcuC-like enzyme